MSYQSIRNLVNQVIKEHLSPDVVKDLETINGSVGELSEAELNIAKEAFSNIPHLQSESDDQYADFQGKNVQLNSPSKGEQRDYMAYIQKEGKTVKVHFDAKSVS